MFSHINFSNKSMRYNILFFLLFCGNAHAEWEYNSNTESYVTTIQNIQTSTDGVYTIEMDYPINYGGAPDGIKRYDSLLHQFTEHAAFIDKPKIIIRKNGIQQMFVYRDVELDNKHYDECGIFDLSSNMLNSRMLTVHTKIGDIKFDVRGFQAMYNMDIKEPHIKAVYDRRNAVIQARKYQAEINKEAGHYVPPSL